MACTWNRADAQRPIGDVGHTRARSQAAVGIGEHARDLVIGDVAMLEPGDRASEDPPRSRTSQTSRKQLFDRLRGLGHPATLPCRTQQG